MAKRSIVSVGLVVKRGHSQAIALAAALAQWLRARTGVVRRTRRCTIDRG